MPGGIVIFIAGLVTGLALGIAIAGGRLRRRERDRLMGVPRVDHLRAREAGPGASVGSGDIDPEVAALVRQGRKIDAIKLLRERTGMGLKEAKDSVERLG